MSFNGLFGANNGTIRDLVINSGQISGGNCTGGVVGRNYRKNNKLWKQD